MKTKNHKTLISMIAAIARDNRTIGKEGGGIPWRIKEDFTHFKNTTMNHPIIMGRKTWEEFNGRPLLGRTHIIVTRQENYTAPEGHFVCDSLLSAIEKAKELDRGEIFIIGGAQIYAEGLQFADRIYLTLIDTQIDGPAKFPEYKSVGFTKLISSRKSQDENFNYEFVVLEKN